MKKIAIAFFLFPFFCHAQLIAKKSVIIISISGGVHPVQLLKDEIQGDTIYSFIFRNRKYETLTDIKDMRIKKAELPTLIKGLIAVQSIDNGDLVSMPTFAIAKQKAAFGGNRYWFSYDDGYCYLTEKDVKKLLMAVQSEL